MTPRRDIFQAIADPTRRKIIELVAEKPQNVNAISEHFSMSRQAVSLHVKVLEECDLLAIAKEGRERFCSLKVEKLAEVDEWLEPYRQQWEHSFHQLDQLLNQIKEKNDEK